MAPYSLLLNRKIHGLSVPGAFFLSSFVSKPKILIISPGKNDCLSPHCSTSSVCLFRERHPWNIKKDLSFL